MAAAAAGCQSIYKDLRALVQVTSQSIDRDLSVCMYLCLVDKEVHLVVRERERDARSRGILNKKQWHAVCSERMVTF